MFQRLSLILLLLLVPLLGKAATGDYISSTNKGVYTVQSFWLYDDDPAAANELGDQFDVNTSAEGIPDSVLFTVVTNTGCAGVTVVVRNYQNDTDTTYGILAAPVMTATARRMFKSEPLAPIFASYATLADACNPLQVRMDLFYRKDLP